MVKKIIIFISLLTAAIGVRAQSDCERMLNAAIEDYYNKGKYEQALMMFKSIQSDCGKKYGGAERYIKDCNSKLQQEEAVYKKCSTIEACNHYLNTYPNGRFGSKVRQKRAELTNVVDEAQLKAEEDAAYEKCETEAACKAYLAKYPHGRYINQVKSKLELFVEKRLEKEEVSAFQKCTTEEACKEYLAKYPDGKYVDNVNEKLLYFRCTTEEICEEYMVIYPNGYYVEQVAETLAELKRLRKEEYDAYKICTTEEACEEYLRKYPKGKYFSEVKSKKDNFVAERKRKQEMEAAKTAYMKIRKIEFANVNEFGVNVGSYGGALYASDIKYLKPNLIYDGILDEPRQVLLYCKLFAPEGSMKFNESSPAGYTYHDSFFVQPGEGNTVLLTGWGSNAGGTYTSGKYTLELWYEGERIYQTSIILKNRENALTRGNWLNAVEKCTEYATKKYSYGIYKGQLRSDSTRLGLGMYYGKDDGDLYVGEWRSNKKWGIGIYMASTGHTVSNCPQCMYYVGEFEANKKQGQGSCYDQFGNLIYDGYFEEDMPMDAYPIVGRNNYKFECLEIPGGNYYIGETKNGKRQGEGVYIWNNGNMWAGSWENDEREGYGIYMRYEGSFYTGTWENGVKQ